ncbi:MAG TPA: Lrp/AsnC ligand binding domain-containing protein [Candidatus Acidoferrales bacterium]|jgi:DNA-binding Lrp family transcriptional regulator
MLRAYILVDTSTDADLLHSASQILHIKHVRTIATTTGSHDFVVRVECEEEGALEETIIEIRKMEGIKKTETLVVLSESTPERDRAIR